MLLRLINEAIADGHALFRTTLTSMTISLNRGYRGKLYTEAFWGGIDENFH